jgi:transposase
MKLMRIGVDLAKNVFQIHGVDRHEQPVWRQRLSRERWLQTVLEKIEPGCEIGMESCSGAHHWARQLQARGFRVRLIAPQFVKPYVKSNKNDANDAEAICEAMSRPSIRFVAVKTIEQQDIQATHRIRAGLIEQRTAKANQIRGLIAEYGLVAPKELLMLRRAIPCWLEEADNGLTVRFRRLLDGLWGLRTLDERVGCWRRRRRRIDLRADAKLPNSNRQKFSTGNGSRGIRLGQWHLGNWVNSASAPTRRTHPEKHQLIRKIVELKPSFELCWRAAENGCIIIPSY